MKRFKFLNNVVGWVVFLIAAVTYLLTIEPTASFWDCGEFISTADKLEVGHPPGAPFFMLTAKFFTLFASDQAHVAMMVNSFSAICSAFVILFLFWTITRLARKILVADNKEINLEQTILILGAGTVGALAYTFSDTFWFSAVEGEVYAYSSLFTAVGFWAILKWEEADGSPYANRWLIFIAYWMGLSIGVHLLNLLTIPVVVLVYYYKKFQVTTKGTILALLVSCVILGLVLYGIIPGFVQVAGWFELFFVNTLGFSFNVGTIIYAILLIACLVWGIIETMPSSNGNIAATQDVVLQTDSVKKNFKKKEKEQVNPTSLRANIAFFSSLLLLGIPFLGGRIPALMGIIVLCAIAAYIIYSKKFLSASFLNTVLLCCMVILLGYSTYATVIIRSVANTPMDQNSPDDVFALKSYLNREQYGDTPLLYGESYASELRRVRTNKGWELDIDEFEGIYAKKVKTSENEKDSYELYDHKKKYKYDLCMPFPRMYSKQASHIEAYKQWANIKGHKVRYKSMGENKTKIVPTFGENLTFFFKYQVGWMYWRYFMWNFSGRQNDIQGHGGAVHGNWITGINAIDSFMLGDQESMPDELKNNKGHNVYYLLPLLLGLMGIAFQFMKGKKGMQSFWITATLFFMTGLAIVLYLNQTPYQPRERDYAYAGSFYAFCIWIGLGVLFLHEILKMWINGKISATVVTLACLGVPALMAAQNWDDHDRSNRYTCRDFGQNYLLSLQPNSVIFTNGDNDTFPLWYNQEVEGVGTDSRVANLSYLQMGWYVDQMKRQAYESDPLPLSLEAKDYMNGRLDIAYMFNVVPELKFDMAVEIAKNPEKYKQYNPYDDDKMNFIPTKNFVLDIDKNDVLSSGVIPAKDIVKVPDQIRLNLSSKGYLGKHEVMILDLLQQNKWKRPLYFAVTVGGDSYMGLQRYLSLEGMAYRILPCPGGVLSKGEQVNIERTYDNLLHKFKWGGIAENPNIYMDENNLRMTSTLRFMFVRLSDAIMAESHRAEVMQQYCNALLWALSQEDNRPDSPNNMSVFRTLSRYYYDNDRITSTTSYSDSMLISNAPAIACEILGCSKQTPKIEMMRMLDDHGKKFTKDVIDSIKAANKSKVIEVLDYCNKVMPVPQIPYTTANIMMARTYLELGEVQRALKIMDVMKETSIQYLEWISAMDPVNQRASMDEFSEKFSIFAEILQLNQTILKNDVEKDLALYDKYMQVYRKWNK